MERARADLKPREQRPATPTSNAVDGCWSRDRVSVAAASLRSGSGPPLSYASVTAGRGGRMGQGTGHGPVPRTTNKTNPKPASVSAPGAKKNRTALAVANLFASLADVTGGAPTGRPVSPLPEAGSDTAPTKSAGCSGTLGTDAVEEVLHSPKAKRRRVRKRNTGKAGLKTASLQYQLLLEQRKTKVLEKKLQEITPAPQRENLRTELNELFDTAGVEPQPQQGTGESQSLDVSLWKLMISLLQTRLTGDREPLLRNLTALISELTGQGLTGLARSGDKDLSSATRWPTDCSFFNLFYIYSFPTSSSVLRSCSRTVVSHPGISQRLGRSDLPLQGRNLLPWSADTPCSHHAPDTHGLVEGHVRAHTLCLRWASVFLSCIIPMYKLHRSG